MAARRRFCISPELSDDEVLDAAVQRWALRMLVPLGGHRRMVQSHGFESNAVAVALGLGHWVDAASHAVPEFLRRRKPRPSRREASGDDGIEYDQKAALADLRALHTHAEARQEAGGDGGLPGALVANVQQLAAAVGLGVTDQRVLEFAVMLHTEYVLTEVVECLGALCPRKLTRVLAVVLAVPEAAIQAALSPNGVLHQAGLVSVDRSGSMYLGQKLTLLSGTLADDLLTAGADTGSLLRGVVARAPAGELPLIAWAHLGDTLDIARAYLQHARSSARRGVNLFVHGAPGTGKTQLARALADALGCELYEVACEDGDGDPINGEARLRAYRAAQHFFARRPALIVFDEAEDVFNDGDQWFGKKSTAQTRKAWINRALEENPVPTLWISNSRAGIDPAFIRRFDLVMELPVPPRSERARLLREAGGGLVSEALAGQLATVETLAPAVVTRVATVVQAVAPALGSACAAKGFTRLLSNVLEAQGHRPLPHGQTTGLPAVYDPAFIHADADLAAIAQGLAASRSGRICLFGPPGTGKSAFGQYVARQLDAPLHLQRVSDMKSMWVGESEKNIARAFRAAAADDAVLLIDEVDSFLRDRRGAQQGWEVSEVNEMLTQIEDYPGVLIVSTNLIDDIDPAALRRFDLKVRFDFLRPAQAKALLIRHCEALALPAPAPAALATVAQLTRLTPGDFAAVTRQHRFRPIGSATALADALAAECAAKGETRRAPGFV